jgi:hypothetical protein
MPTPNTNPLQGTLDMLILKALSLGPLHGYGIGQRIMQMSEDALRVEEGSLSLSGSLPNRAAGMDHGRVGRVGEQSLRQVL